MSSVVSEGNTQEIDDEESTIATNVPMILKHSTRLSSKEESSNLKIVSWNINGIRAWLTNGGLKYLDEEQADIVCFQVSHLLKSIGRLTSFT